LLTRRWKVTWEYWTKIIPYKEICRVTPVRIDWLREAHDVTWPWSHRAGSISESVDLCLQLTQAIYPWSIVAIRQKLPGLQQ
jgi:hypothetical protein